MDVRMRPSQSLLCIILAFLGSAGCGSTKEPLEKPSAFELRFAAVVDGHEVGCNDDLTGFGPSGGHRIGLNDLRFYVSNLKFKDRHGRDVDLTLDKNEFQHFSSEGSVALVDLTGNTEGNCSPTSVAYAEGTGRTHLSVTGRTLTRTVTSVSFDIGVPQPVMKKTIATNTPEGAPSPLNEMYWNWNTGYRHLVLNFSVRDASGGTGAGYLHIGSRDCAPTMDGVKALGDRDSCTFINTPSVAMAAFDLESNTIGLDIRKVLDGIDFVSPVYDPITFAPIGQGPGVECHSSPMQPDCAPIFGHFGLEMDTGKANPSTDIVFIKM